MENEHADEKNSSETMNDKQKQDSGTNSDQKDQDSKTNGSSNEPIRPKWKRTKRYANRKFWNKHLFRWI
ncbi:hypothetical protein HYD54_02715 [Mycoplasmopsis bovis]|nr:hypothetical protein [Mycoplasmopsis bovis]QQH71874.1 hypothetical protein HYD54_02715 [Mycoplasmopsis bovis]